MTTIGSHDAQSHFAELLRRVERGEDVTIARNGVPVAKLVPVDAPKKLTPREAIEGILELRKGHSLGGLSIRELIDEGRRF